MKRCPNCGYVYRGKRCPVCGFIPENVPESREVLYGPPPIEREEDFKPQPPLYGPPPIPQPDVYGPPPIDCGIDPKPQPVIYGPPPAKKSSCSMILLAVVALLGGLIAWLVAGCSNANQPTVYGPPPVDTTQTAPPITNE